MTFVTSRNMSPRHVALCTGSRPVGEEYVNKAAQHRAAARLARVVPYDLETNEKLDPMAILEEAMQHFYRKAKIEQTLGRFCDFRIVDNAIQNAARIAREIVSFRHPRISAIKLAVADPNADLLRGDMTSDEMREIIRRKLIEDGLLPAPIPRSQILVENNSATPKRNGAEIGAIKTEPPKSRFRKS